MVIAADDGTTPSNGGFLRFYDKFSVKAEGLPGKPIRWITKSAAGDEFIGSRDRWWHGIECQYNEGPVRISHNIFSQAGWPVYLFAPIDQINIESNVINYCITGIYLRGVSNTRASLANNRILNVGGAYGISIYQGKADVSNNTISGTMLDGLSVAGGSPPATPRVMYNIIEGARTGIYASSAPTLRGNLVWNWSDASYYYAPGLSGEPIPLIGNPRFVSSRERGFYDSSEHYFLSQLPGDASRLPWTILDLVNSGGINVHGLSGSGGVVTLYSVDANLNYEAKGAYIVGNPTPYIDGDETMADSAAVAFQGPLSFDPDARITFTRNSGSEMVISVPKVWRDEAGVSIALGNVWVFWIALDGSLYYAMKDHLMGGWDATARYSMQYDMSLNDKDDLDDGGYGNYEGGLALSNYDAYYDTSDPYLASKALDAIEPDPGFAYYDYAGTASKFERNNEILLPAYDSGNLDLGFHPFRGRIWSRNPTSLKLSWDPPSLYDQKIVRYEAAVKPYGNSVGDFVTILEDGALDASGYSLQNTDIDQPHEIHLRAIAVNASGAELPPGEEDVIYFGLDRVPPSLSPTFTPAILPPTLFYDAANVTLYYHPDVLSQLSSFTVHVAPTDSLSGVWKVVVDDSAKDFAEEYSNRPVNPTSR